MHCRRGKASLCSDCADSRRSPCVSGSSDRDRWLKFKVNNTILNRKCVLYCSYCVLLLWGYDTKKKKTCLSICYQQDLLTLTFCFDGFFPIVCFKPLSPTEANKELPSLRQQRQSEQPFVSANKLGAGRVSQRKRGQMGEMVLNQSPRQHVEYNSNKTNLKTLLLLENHHYYFRHAFPLQPPCSQPSKGNSPANPFDRSIDTGNMCLRKKWIKCKCIAGSLTENNSKEIISHLKDRESRQEGDNDMKMTCSCGKRGVNVWRGRSTKIHFASNRKRSFSEWKNDKLSHVQLQRANQTICIVYKSN